MKSTIDVQNLSKQFPKSSTRSVDGISFSVPRGHIMALLGPNGAGKTTTIKMILGLVHPSQGSVRVCGYDVTQESQRRRVSKHIGAVLEGARNAYWRLSARDNLIYFGSLRGIARRQLKSRIDELLNFLELSDSADKEVRLFSRGMQQKLAIAIALLHDPDILLLDEPTLGLDVQAAKLLENRIADLANQGKSIILTTHTMPLAETLASSIFVMHQGKQLAYADKSTLLSKFQNQSIIDIRLGAALTIEQHEVLQQRHSKLHISTDGNNTILSWPDAHQREVAALHNYLAFADINVESIQSRRATLEELFVSLTNPAAQ